MKRKTVIRTNAGPKKAIPSMEFDLFFILSCVTLEFSVYPFYRLMSNDTHASILLNIIIRKYGTLPDRFKIVGFDNSPISRESVIPITTVGQQVDKIAEEAMQLLIMQIDESKKRRPIPLDKPIHRIFTPILIRRETTK